ncbi:hypothetical protein HCC30_27975 [Streptomyces sp. HNM0574]|nr:hypothetical protein [Streptomyces sp. HNM0574]
MGAEVPSTVPVLAHESHFALMRGYRSFTFASHRSHLRETQRLLRLLTGLGLHTRLALFDPVAYARFCETRGLDPDTPDGRTRFTTEVAAHGPTLRYRGERLRTLLPRLFHTYAHHLARDRAAHLLTPDSRPPADSRPPLQGSGTAALHRATHALRAVLDAVGEGTHHLVCSCTLPSGPVTLALETTGPSDTALRTPEARSLTTVLASAFATASPGGLVLRTSRPGHHDAVRGWIIEGSWLRALTAAEVFDAYCTDPTTGDPVPPEPDVDHLPGIDIPPPESP